jgi:hypothetical protein
MGCLLGEDRSSYSLIGNSINELSKEEGKVLIVLSSENVKVVK